MVADTSGSGLHSNQKTGEFSRLTALERPMLVAERFIASLLNRHGKHLVSTDWGTWYPPQASRFLIEKSFAFHVGEKPDRGRTTQHKGQDRTESFDDYFHAAEKGTAN